VGGKGFVRTATDLLKGLRYDTKAWTDSVSPPELVDLNYFFAF